MLICTAGHVDHGKTALVKALTGVDADRLPEEKRRGITLDLGYAYTDALGFVDVPGHERLVHTMLAGAGGIDAALLVVAADDGVMPQTREHAAILDLLGIDRGVIAVTKADLTPEQIPAVTAEIRALLAKGGLAGAAIMPVSAVTGEGVTALRAALEALAAREQDTDGHARLAIDRVFSLPGAGLVVAGTLVAGRIAAEDRLLLSPSGREVRVRGLHVHGHQAVEAVAGRRVALNIAGTRLAKEHVSRGDWVVHPDLHAPTSRIDAGIRLLAGALAPRSDTTVHLHLAAAHVTARITPLQSERLTAGAAALVRLTLSTPIGALAGDRLVLRNADATLTLGGGTVLDPFPPLRGRHAPARLAQLAALQEADPVRALGRLLALPPGFTDLAAYSRARNLPPPRIAAMLAEAPALPLGPLAIAPAALEELRLCVLQALAAHHEAAPDQPGLPPERIGRMLPGRPPQTAMHALLDRLLAEGAIAQDGPWLRLPDHRVSLSAEDERLWAAMRELIAAAPFRPPRTRDMARALDVREAVLRATLKRLQRAGRLIEIAQDHFFLRETVAAMAMTAAELAEAPAGLTAATFRDRLDNGRKVAIQILEFFDRAGLTGRAGEVRRVRADRAGMFGQRSD
jgi:selenocysteine-specific elongation factor